MNAGDALRRKRFSFGVFVFIMLVLAGLNPSGTAASPSLAMSDWRLPLPAGTYRIVQGDEDSCTSTHCRAKGYGQSVYCAVDLVSANINGLPVLAPADGTVLDTGWQKNTAGNYMTIVHDDGLVSQYQHLQVSYVSADDRVVQGQPIARVDSTGRSTGSHLHFVVFKDSSKSECVKISTLDGNTDFKTDARVTSTNEQNGSLPDDRPVPIAPAPPIGQRPDSPSLSSPGNGDRLAESTEVVFRWSAASGATQYYLEYSGGPVGTLNSGWQSQTEYRVGRMWPGTYQWKVKARSASGESGWSSTFTFTIEGSSPTITTTPSLTNTPPPGAPPAPALREPAGGSVWPQTYAVRFTWEAVPGAAEYYLEYSGGPYGALNSGWIGGTEFSVGPMWPGTYTWHVKARNAGGAESGWSESRVFTIEGPTSTPVSTPTVTPSPVPEAPAPPALRDPGDGLALPESTDVWFAWDAVSGGAQYYLEYWGGPYGTLNSGWINDTAYHIGPMWPGAYSWRVRARNAGGVEGSWSATRGFTVADASTATPTTTAVAPPPEPSPSWKLSLSSPENGALLPRSTDVTLVWNGLSGASQYKVELWGGAYSRMTPCDWQAATTCHIGEMWPGNVMWRVRARDGSGQESEWSDEWNFTIMN